MTKNYQVIYGVFTPVSNVKYFKTRELMQDFLDKLITQTINPTGHRIEQAAVTVTIKTLKIEE